MCLYFSIVTNNTFLMGTRQSGVTSDVRSLHPAYLSKIYYQKLLFNLVLPRRGDNLVSSGISMTDISLHCSQDELLGLIIYGHVRTL